MELSDADEAENKALGVMSRPDLKIPFNKAGEARGELNRIWSGVVSDEMELEGKPRSIAIVSNIAKGMEAIRNLLNAKPFKRSRHPFNRNSWESTSLC